MLTTLLIVATAAALFYYFIVKPYDYWKERGVKHGKFLWLFGNNFRTVFRLEGFPEMVHSIYNQFPDTRYTGFYQFFLPSLMLRDPELIKQITVKDFDHFTDHKEYIPADSNPVWSKNLVALKGQPWREMRTILSPSFTSSKMKAMFVLMTECAENFVQHFLKKDEEIITLEIRDVFTRFTNDVIATTAFGIKVDSLAELDNEFYTMGKETTDFTGLWRNLKFFLNLLSPGLTKILKLTLFDEKTNDFFVNLVTESIKNREEKGIVRPDMINLLMEARKGIHRHEENGIIDTGFATAQESESVKTKITKELTDLDIAAQCFVFFFAGFDTVSTLMYFVAYELAVNQDIQERLRKEVVDTLEECGGKITYEGLLKMKYLDMVISEVLRKWPNADVIDRVCTKPYVLEPATPKEKPLYIERGTNIWLPVFGLHRDPQYFPDPERFDPERFSDENKGDIKPYTYFPFGLGPRNCIGSRFALLESKLIFFYILSHFKIVPVEQTQIPLQISKKTFNLTAEGGIWLGLKRIN